MTTRKTGHLAICRHVLIGAQLKVMIDLIGCIHMALYWAYPKKSKAVQRASAVWKAIESLKSELDEIYARETPHDGRYWASKVYYGMESPDAWESEVTPILAQHHEEHPACDVTVVAIRDWVLRDLLTRVQRNSPVCYVSPEKRYHILPQEVPLGGRGSSS